MLLARRSSSRYRIVAVDQRGNGAGERRLRDVSRAACVVGVFTIVDQPALSRPVLMRGHNGTKVGPRAWPSIHSS
ncbi:hypothetical protein [Streptomyces sp. NPDC093149]|uniref:hypothetical protein n=1 Tax=Streptomyces sp. NPDC093149 TaxID=3366031 RepID=UPI0037F12AE8